LLKPSEQQEMERIQGALGTFQEGHEELATTRITRELLLGGMFFWNGARCLPFGKYVGAGVYVLTVKKF